MMDATAPLGRSDRSARVADLLDAARGGSDDALARAIWLRALFLERERVPTSFFVSGLWAEANQDAFRRLMRSPFFEIALHGHRHPRLIGASAETIAAEIEDGRAALIRLGADPARGHHGAPRRLRLHA